MAYAGVSVYWKCHWSRSWSWSWSLIFDLWSVMSHGVNGVFWGEGNGKWSGLLGGHLEVFAVHKVIHGLSHRLKRKETISLRWILLKGVILSLCPGNLSAAIYSGSQSSYSTHFKWSITAIQISLGLRGGLPVCIGSQAPQSPSTWYLHNFSRQ